MARRIAYLKYVEARTLEEIADEVYGIADPNAANHSFQEVKQFLKERLQGHWED